MAYEKHVWSSNELITAAQLNHIEDGVAAAKTADDIVNNLTETAAGKILDATQGKTLNDSKLDKNFSSNTYTSAATPFTGNEKIPVQQSGNNVYTDFNTLSSYFGGSGSTQAALVNYKR